MSMVQGTAPSSYYDVSLGRTRTPSDSVDSEAFMSLLVAQLRYQDPTSPMDQTQFMQQLATMSSMQQQTEINNQLASIVESNGVASAINLIGHDVSGMVDGKEVSGKVEAVTLVDGKPNFKIGNVRLPYSQVYEVQ